MDTCEKLKLAPAMREWCGSRRARSRVVPKGVVGRTKPPIPSGLPWDVSTVEDALATSWPAGAGRGVVGRRFADESLKTAIKSVEVALGKLRALEPGDQAGAL